MSGLVLEGDGGWGGKQESKTDEVPAGREVYNPVN